MATTYTLISSSIVSGSTTASVTFSSIPATYTDLLISSSARSSAAGTSDSLNVEFNGNTATSYSMTYLRGLGSGTSTSNDLNTTFLFVPYAAQGNTTLANTFTSTEMYFPNYLAAINKPSSQFVAFENNTTVANLIANAGLYRNTTAISSIKLTVNGGPYFIANSSFYLYGIKNS
jgi:hypothetical protein